MYGECEVSDSNPNAKYNCKYRGEAKPLESNASSLLKDLCPHLYLGEKETRTCCDYAQLKRLYDDMSLPKQLMSRCPACYRNFKAFLCDMTCGPNQADFLFVPDGGEKNFNNTKTEVTKYTYHITNNYTQNLFDSCK